MKKHSRNKGFEKSVTILFLNLTKLWSRVKFSPPLGGLTLNSPEGALHTRELLDQGLSLF
jgi:hypothetical protein